jgi:hypothetical protein
MPFGAISYPEVLDGRTSSPAGSPEYVRAVKVTEPSAAELVQKTARGPAAETVELITDTGVGDDVTGGGATGVLGPGAARFGAAGSGRSSARTNVRTTDAITPATSNATAKVRSPRSAVLPPKFGLNPPLRHRWERVGLRAAAFRPQSPDLARDRPAQGVSRS